MSSFPQYTTNPPVEGNVRLIGTKQGFITMYIKQDSSLTAADIETLWLEGFNDYFVHYVSVPYRVDTQDTRYIAFWREEDIEVCFPEGEKEKENEKEKDGGLDGIERIAVGVWVGGMVLGLVGIGRYFLGW